MFEWCQSCIKNVYYIVTILGISKAFLKSFKNTIKKLSIKEDLKLMISTVYMQKMMSITNLLMGDNSNNKQGTAIIFACDYTPS